MPYHSPKPPIRGPILNEVFALARRVYEEGGSDGSNKDGFENAIDDLVDFMALIQENPALRPCVKCSAREDHLVLLQSSAFYPNQAHCNICRLCLLKIAKENRKPKSTTPNKRANNTYLKQGQFPKPWSKINAEKQTSQPKADLQ